MIHQMKANIFAHLIVTVILNLDVKENKCVRKPDFLRNSSLHSNVFNVYITFEVCDLHCKKDINVYGPLKYYTF